MKPITARQKQIVGAALEIISEHGLEALTVKNLAARVGFSDAAVYRHFKNKAQILSTVIDLFARDSAKLLAQIESKDLDSLDKIRFFFLDRCRTFAAERVLATVMFAESLFQNDPQLAAKMHQVLGSHREKLLKIIRQGQKQKAIRSLPAEHLFTMVMGSLRMLVLHWRVSGYGFDLAQAGEKLWHSIQTLIRNKNRRIS